MNSLNDSIALLQKRYDAADAEKKEIADYKARMEGNNSESNELLSKASRELAAYKNKHKALVK